MSTDSQRKVEFYEYPQPDGSLAVKWQANTQRDWNRILKLIKDAIPPGGRAFDSPAKLWVIASSHVSTYENIKQAVLAENDEILGSVDEELNNETIAKLMEVNLKKLPNSMRDKAWYAIQSVLGIIQTDVEFCVSEQRFGAYNPDMNLWFYEDGRYSSISPSERDERIISKAFNRVKEAYNQLEHAIEKLDTEYSKYPESWKRLFRIEMLEKYGYRCYTCGTRPHNLTHLHMHRVIPGKIGGMYLEDNVVIVCVNCHRKHEGDGWDVFHNLHHELTNGSAS